MSTLCGIETEPLLGTLSLAIAGREARGQELLEVCALLFARAEFAPKPRCGKVLSNVVHPHAVPNLRTTQPRGYNPLSSQETRRQERW